MKWPLNLVDELEDEASTLVGDPGIAHILAPPPQGWHIGVNYTLIIDKVLNAPFLNDVHCHVAASRLRYNPSGYGASHVVMQLNDPAFCLLLSLGIHASLWALEKACLVFYPCLLDSRLMD